jgi:chromosome segregation ATPase
MLVLCVVALGFVTAFRFTSAARTNIDPAPQQDIIRLEQRINQLEQRLFSIENNLRSVEQQSRMGSATLRTVNPEDFARLRLELNALQQRLAEHECALAKLDERTLSAAIRNARRKSGAGANDPCRQNFDSPVQLTDGRR